MLSPSVQHTTEAREESTRTFGLAIPLGGANCCVISRERNQEVGNMRVQAVQRGASEGCEELTNEIGTGENRDGALTCDRAHYYIPLPLHFPCS